MPKPTTVPAGSGARPDHDRGERRRLAQGYFWYFTTVGVLVPYWPPYLASRGLDPLEIGLLMGVFSAMRVVGPPVHAHWADVTGRRLPLLRRAAGVAFCCALAFAWLDSAWSLAVVLALYSATWSGVMSIYDAHVLERTGTDSGRYGILRLWGSIGFIVVSVAAGRAFEQFGLDGLPWLLAGLVAMTWSTLRGPDPGRAAGDGASHVGLAGLLAGRQVQVFLLVTFLAIASHGAYYNFLTIYLESAGFGRTAIGLLWAWAVVAEVGVFLGARALLMRFDLRALTVGALVATACRWVMLAVWVDSGAIVFLAQTLHLASFGLFHLCAVSLAARLFPSDAAARGQALHGSVGYGLGGMVGAVGSGWFWREVSPEAAFLCSAGLAAVAALLAFAGLGGLRRGGGRVHNA